MNKRYSEKPEPDIEGLGGIIIQALETMASKDASQAIVQSALARAGLRKLPEDPVVLLAFLSGALYGKASEALGQESAEAMLFDAKPILERAAEHALALEAAGALPEELADEAEAPPTGAALAAPEVSTKARAARSRRTTDPMGSAAVGGQLVRARPPPKPGDSRRQTAPGVGAGGAQGAASYRRAAEAPSVPPRSPVPRAPRDPRRSTLGYEAVVDEPTDGQSGRPCGVVAVGDKTLRSIVARILRREGFGVVTAPDGSLGTLLARRFSAAIVVVDGESPLTPEGATALPQAAPRVVLDTDVSAEEDAVVGEGYARIGAKPLDPARLVRAIEQLLPEGWRR